MEKRADKRGAGGSKQPTCCTLSDGFWPLPPGIPSSSQDAPQKGQLSVQEQPKKQNNCQNLLGTKQKTEKKVVSYSGGNCSCQHTHTARDVSQARKYTFLINSTELETGPDGPLVGPHMATLCVIFEEIALGFLRGRCESPWAAGGWDCNT